jgi:hypothetical protein
MSISSQQLCKERQAKQAKEKSPSRKQRPTKHHSLPRFPARQRPTSRPSSPSNQPPGRASQTSCNFLSWTKPQSMADQTPAQAVPSSRPAPSIASINTTRSPPKDHPLSRAPSSPQMNHRATLAENLRGNPTSPRTPHRSPSLSQQALQELLNNPPTAKSTGTDEFAGRDWRTVTVGEVVDLELVRFVEMDTSVEEATNVSCFSCFCSCQFADV